MSTTGLMLSLTREQAIVLFDWLSREEERDSIPTEHPAEMRVLWEIEAQLEQGLVEPFQPDYPAIVASAREQVEAGAPSGRDARHPYRGGP